jgi:hypothetical protein
MSAKLMPIVLVVAIGVLAACAAPAQVYESPAS